MTDWIECSKIMPPNETDVLCHVILDKSRHDVFIGHYNEAGWYRCGLYESIQLIDDEDILKVIHWMPLPSIDGLEK